MAKLVFSVLMIVIWWMLHALQLDEEAAMGTLHEAKRAVDRAVHAAAQRQDRGKLELGVPAIDAAAAETAAWDYLQANLSLNAELEPTVYSFLKEPVEVLAFEVINDDHTFPYHYANPTYGYEVMLNRPGVVLIVRVVYPRLFGVLAPVEWTLTGTAELVY